MNLKNIMLTERSHSQKTICDSIHMECLEYANLCREISSCLGLRWLGGMGSDWYEVAFWSDENVLGFTVVMVPIKMLGRKEGRIWGRGNVGEARTRPWIPRYYLLMVSSLA